MSKISLSIIIPAYNAEAFIQRCIDSILNQSFNENQLSYEIIVVNDGSIDKTLEKILEYSNLGKVNLITQNNKGLSEARNRGFDAARYDYIWFIDADDYIEDGAFSHIVECINLYPDIDISSFKLKKITPNGEVTGYGCAHTIDYGKVHSGMDSLRNGYTPSSVCSLIIKNSLLQSHELSFLPKVAHQDIELTARLFFYAKKVIFFDESYYNYVCNSGSISQNKSNKQLKKYLLDEIKVAQSIATFSKDLSIKDRRVYQKIINNIIWNLTYRLCFLKSDSYEVKVEVYNELIKSPLYPISGVFGTNFQKITAVLFSNNFFMRYMIGRFK